MNLKSAASHALSFLSGGFAVFLIASAPLFFVDPVPRQILSEPDTVEIQPPQRPLSLFIAGDVLLARGVGSVMRRSGPDFMFRDMKTIIESCDIAFANLETPIGFKGTPFPGKPENITFRADPSVVLSLKNAGFDIVSLANNHMNDYGPECVRETIQYLAAAGIAFAGAGIHVQDAYAPAAIVSNGKKVAFLAFAEPIWSVIEAGESAPGVAVTRTESVLQAIRTAKASVQPDVLVVSFHWGDEYSHRPKDDQKVLARAAIDAGADIIAGHHPHVLQGVEKYKAGIIFYSLGNFTFDMRSPSTYDSMYAVIELKPEGGIGTVQVCAASIDLKTFSPSPSSSETGGEILKSIAGWSNDLGTKSEFRQNSLAF